MENDARRTQLPPDITLAMPNGRTSNGSGEGPSPAAPVIDAIGHPLLLLDGELRVTAANRAFCLTFGLSRDNVLGRPFHALGDGQWDVPELRARLNEILPRHSAMESFEIEQEFSGLGWRTMLLDAREVVGGLSGEQGSHPGILLAIEDITDRRTAERALRAVVQERNALLQEIPDRVATSLQIVASALRSSARMMDSGETRRHLEDAHNRVMALSALQRLLRAPDSGARVMVGPYLTRLCEILAPVERGGGRPVSVQVRAGTGTLSSGQAVTIGLAMTELVVNALEHAFPDEVDDATVIVAFDQAGPDWTLTVSDNGIGRPEGQWDKSYPGLGTVVIETLARRLDASLEVAMDVHGTTVSVIHGAPLASRPSAAGPVLRLVRDSDGEARTKRPSAMREHRT